MPHTKETSLPTAEQLDMERRRLLYKRRYNRTLRSTVAILIVVAALAVMEVPWRRRFITGRSSSA